MEDEQGRVIINACVNATGTIKLPLQVIGKAKCPRCFRGLRMDCRVLWPENSWMSSEIFCGFFCPSNVQTTLFTWLG